MALTSYPDSEDAGWRKALAAQSDESQQPAVSSDSGLPWWPLALSEALDQAKRSELASEIGGSYAFLRFIAPKATEFVSRADVSGCA